MALRLGGAAFQRIGKEMMTTKIMMMVTMMMTMMMMMTFVGEGRGGFSQDWPINCDDDTKTMRITMTMIMKVVGEG